jgi:hypothetical protein
MSETNAWIFKKRNCRKMSKSNATILILFLSFVSGAQSPTLSGTWNVTFKGTTTTALRLQQSGTKVTGTLATTDGSPGAVSGTFDGSTLTLSRDTGLQTIQHYRVTVKGSSFSGTYWNEGRLADQGTLEGRLNQTSQPPPQPHGVTYYVENFVYGLPDLFVNPRNIHKFIVDFATCSVWQVNTPEQWKTVTVRVSVCRDRKRLQFTADGPGQPATVQYDWVLLNDGKTISGAYNEGGTWGPSVGGINYP